MENCKLRHEMHHFVVSVVLVKMSGLLQNICMCQEAVQSIRLHNKLNKGFCPWKVFTIRYSIFSCGIKEFSIKSTDASLEA